MRSARRPPTAIRSHRRRAFTPGRHQRRPRAGFTLVELVVAAAASLGLMAGLASALLIATKALPTDSPGSSDANRGALALSQLAGDVRQALRFSERTATAVTFIVPDRTGDSKPETIRYAWGGSAGNPLTYQFNGGAAATIASNVQSFNVLGLTRVMPGEATDVATTSSVSYEGFAEAKASTDTSFLFVPAPSGSSLGKLLIAGVAVDGDQGSYLMAQGGWNRIARIDSTSDVGLGVWWKIAGPNEPTSYWFYWPNGHRAYGWIMRFSGASPTAPINVWASAIGQSTSAACPSVTTTVANALIVRVGGFNNDNITIDSAGISGATTITMDRSSTGSSSVSGGAAYSTLATPGVANGGTFNLTANRDYATVTLAIAPNN